MSHFCLSRNAATAERMRRRLAFLGHTPNGHPLWDQPETGHLVDGYPGYDHVLPRIPRRTRGAAHSKASRLKITRPRGRPWDINEIPRLRKHYPTATKEELLALFPGRSHVAIANAANARGIYRARRPYKPTGNRVLDQVLARARERNWSLADLGRESGNSRYFSHQNWRNGRYNHRVHALAVRVLGGGMRADFGKMQG